MLDMILQLILVLYAAMGQLSVSDFQWVDRGEILVYYDSPALTIRVEWDYEEREWADLILPEGAYAPIPGFMMEHEVHDDFLR